MCRGISRQLSGLADADSLPGYPGNLCALITTVKRIETWRCNSVSRVALGGVIMLKTIKQLATGVLLAVGFVPALATAKSPTDQIQETIQQVKNVVASPYRGD